MVTERATCLLGDSLSAGTLANSGVTATDLLLKIRSESRFIQLDDITYLPSLEIVLESDITLIPNQKMRNT